MYRTASWSQAVSSIGRCTVTLTLHYDRVGGCLLDSFLSASAGTIGWLVAACATIDTLHYASVDNSITVKTRCEKHADAHTHTPPIPANTGMLENCRRPLRPFRPILGLFSAVYSCRHTQCIDLLAMPTVSGSFTHISATHRE